jgi:hypothetical protein
VLVKPPRLHELSFSLPGFQSSVCQLTDNHQPTINNR